MSGDSETKGVRGRRWWPPGFARHSVLLKVLSGLAGFAAGIAAYFGGLHFLSCFVASVTAFMFGLPVSLLLVLALWKTRRKVLSHAGAVCASVALFLVLLIPANGIAYLLCRHNIYRTMILGERLVTQLEAYRQEHGGYPASLDELRRSGVEVRFPPLGRSRFYRASDDRRTFTLSFPDPMGFFDFYHYTSESRRWVLAD